MENIYDFEEKCSHHPAIVRECSQKLIFEGGALGKNAILLKDKSMTFERTRVQNEWRTIYFIKTTSYILVKTAKSLWLQTLTPSLLLVQIQLYLRVVPHPSSGVWSMTCSSFICVTPHRSSSRRSCQGSTERGRCLRGINTCIESTKHITMKGG